MTIDVFALLQGFLESELMSTLDLWSLCLQRTPKHPDSYTPKSTFKVEFHDSLMFPVVLVVFHDRQPTIVTTSLRAPP